MQYFLMKKSLLIAIAILLGVLLFLSQTPLLQIAKYRLFPNYPANQSQNLQLDGLKEEVTVVFDGFGIPHIEAKNLADLVRATGFIQARYRGFQLDLLRKFASGRLSEMLGNQKALGSSTVEFDLAMRGWGFEERTTIDLNKLPERDQLILKSFSDGVNQGMERYPAIEHEILGQKPKPWTYQDTLLVGLLQAWSITHNWEQEAIRFSLAMDLGFELAEKIYPLAPIYEYGTLDREDEGASLPPKAAPEALRFINEIATKAAGSKQTKHRKLQTSFGDLMQLRPAASNAWVVGSEMSDSGSAILHNDMHLTHSLPSLIFLQHIKMPGLNAVGATMPGLPFLISGFNGSVAWGVTSAVADVVDLVMEKEDPKNPGLALNETRECQIKNIKTVIKVKDGKDREFILRKSCNGPILNDMYPGFLPEGSPLMAARFEFPRVHESFGNFLDANKADDVYELRRALMKIPSPIQNILAADMKGNIGFFATGSVPIRQGHRGLFPVPGWLKKYEWTGWMSEEEMPHEFNPGKGYFINSNNLVHNPKKNTPLFHVDSGPSHRFDRIKKALKTMDPKDQESLLALQRDNKLARAQKILPNIFPELEEANLEKESEKEALDILKTWDLTSEADSNGVAVFMALFRKSIHVALEDKVSESSLHAFLRQRYSPGIADTWLLDPLHPIWDNPQTELVENRKMALEKSFKLAVAELEQKLGEDPSSWKWGELHYLKPTHTFGKKSVLSFFNLDRVPMAGALDSVWKAHFNLSDFEDPFKVVAGPVYRFSIDMANPDKAGFSTDTGASGWPTSPHYADQFELWNTGELLPIERDFEKVKEARSGSVMELAP